MDHDAQLSKMDPKLKEAYERVMGFDHTAHGGTVSPQSAPKIPEQPTSPTLLQSTKLISPVQAPTAQQSMGQAASTPLEEIPRPTIPLRRSVETVHFETQPSVVEKPKQITRNAKKEKIPSYLYYLGGAVFFIAYTVIWMKILNVPIPFL